MTLRGDSSVEDNASGKGAGIYLNGASGTRPAELYVREDSWILGNTAISCLKINRTNLIGTDRKVNSSLRALHENRESDLLEL